MGENQTNFINRNANAVRSCSPHTYSSLLEERSRTGQQHQDEVRARRDDEEERLEARRTNWLSRHEERRRARELEEMDQERRALAEARQRDWLSRLAIIAYITEHMQAFRDAKA